MHDFANLDYGIGQARRRWLEAADVLNSRALSELRRLLVQLMPAVQGIFGRRRHHTR